MTQAESPAGLGWWEEAGLSHLDGEGSLVPTPAPTLQLMVGQDLSPRKPAISPVGDQAGIELLAAGVWVGNRRTIGAAHSLGGQLGGEGMGENDLGHLWGTAHMGAWEGTPGYLLICLLSLKKNWIIRQGLM